MITARIPLGIPLAALLSLAPLVHAQGDEHSLLRVPEPTKAELAIRQTKVLQTLNRVGDAVVHVSVNIGGVFRVHRYSSGVCIHPSGLVLTNWHLVQEALDKDGKERRTHEVRVRTVKGDEWEAAIVGKDPESDLALLKMRLDEGETMPYVELGDSRAILPGETVLVVSRPDERIYASFIGSASPAQGGIRIQKNSAAQDDLLLSDANIKVFTDGAPVLDINGRLLAIVNSSKVRPPLSKKATEEEKREHRNSFGFAMRVHVARKAFAKQLAKVKTPKITAKEATARRQGIADVVARARGAIVSVRRASIQKMPDPDILDPYGKFANDDLGSGVVVAASGLVLTNAHIVSSKAAADDAKPDSKPSDKPDSKPSSKPSAKPENVIITMLSGKSYPGKVVAWRPDKNIALVQLELPEGTRLPFLRLANSGAGLLGERVAALGNRYGHTLGVQVGVLSSKQRSKDVSGGHEKSMAHFQTDATIHHGNTGGALINLEGQVLGINDVKAAVDKKEETASHEARAALRNTTIGFALPANWIREQLHAELTELAGAEGHLVVCPPATAEVRDRNGHIRLGL